MPSQWSQLNQRSLALYTKHLPTYMCRHPTWGHHRLGSIGLHIYPSTQILVYNCNTYMIPQLIDQSCETLINLIDQSIMFQFDWSINHVSIWLINQSCFNLIDQSIMFQFDQFGQLIKLVKLTKLIKLKHGWSNLVAPSFQTLIKFGWSLNHVKLWSNLVNRSIMSNFDQIWLITQIMSNFDQIWLINQSCQSLCKDNLQE
jgi:hypothetical protein